MATIIGIDLAWSEKNESGLCVLSIEGTEARCERIAALRLTAKEIAELAWFAQPPVIVTVDAPLIIGSERTAERELNSLFNRFNAGAYFASESFLAGMNAMAGPTLGKQLEWAGFSLDPANLGAVDRLALEVYPHPAHVVFFGLDQRLGYKKGSVKQKRDGLALYQQHLARYLQETTPSLADDLAVRGLLRADPDLLGGSTLKRLEDTLDGLTCALIGLHCYREGPAGVHVFGTGRDGYIVVPGPLPIAANRRPRSGKPMPELIEPLAGRRARRAFAPTPVPPDVREALWRAINIAPSHGNTQPSRILVAESPAVRAKLVAALSDGNKSWAPAAPLLFALVANFEGAETPAERELIAFNCGIAVGSLLAQATAMGVTCHPMAAFDEAAARLAFGVPVDVRVLAIVAAGYPGPIDALPPDLREKELAPQYRIPLENLVGFDRWGDAQALSARELRKREK